MKNLPTGVEASATGESLNSGDPAVHPAARQSLVVDMDLVLVLRSKWTCFLRGGQNRLRFCVRAENFFVSIYGSNLTLFLCGPKMNCYLVWRSIDLLVWVVEIDLVLYVGWKSLGFSVRTEIDFFCVDGRNRLDFGVGDAT